MVHMKINGMPDEIEAKTYCSQKVHVNIPVLCYHHPDLPAWAVDSVLLNKRTPQATKGLCYPVQENLSIITHDAELYQLGRLSSR